MQRFFPLAAALLALACPLSARALLAPAPPPAAPAKEAPHPQKLDELEREVLRLVNEERKRAGLPLLTRSPALTRIARDWSRRMAQERFFAHRSPSGHTIGKDVDAARIDWGTLSENLRELVKPEHPAPEAVEQWMQSSIHRGNILDREVTETGVGVWKDGDRYLFTQVFIGPFPE